MTHFDDARAARRRADSDIDRGRYVAAASEYRLAATLYAAAAFDVRHVCPAKADARMSEARAMRIATRAAHAADWAGAAHILYS